ncbi:1-aminocyclopropane-1-carboxylate deaminase [Pedobacter psychrotolerans]|uniref:1-aminocyclopropane-1-carboxylate deaminase n=1 Tax=Pedobacter psychrotolerans TaxID=1843235 RepID=A0A4R2H586_9SPHI|nr:pyridoxal-phosphate dependent enzyme [Pedobacter psychrotolerans]TCO20569.1 1-aminocyclopropane-1-carboxylate deaminase [Pedobacter psychrotolerans]GGE66489.1 1-aminocyclopropane-1-carboxylate deaminase [Pedobacter psychrotolerans]
MFEKIYSPVQKIDLHPLSNLYVKRDDLIDPYISGNKWRKLKYILQKAKAEQKNHLVTFGGAYSNHLVATAAAAARSGLQATAFVRGEEVKNEMLLICSLYGMNLIFVDRESYKNKVDLYKQYFDSDDSTYFIDEGGASVEAVQGCSEIILELTETYDHIFVAAGTGTTAAGLLKGIQDAGLNTKLHVVPVLKGGSFIADEIARYTEISNHLILHTDYHFGGYAKTTPALLAFIKKFTKETGVLIDPVYTAKMFYAILDLHQQNQIRPTDKILAIHTGGLLGLLGMKDKFYFP